MIFLLAIGSFWAAFLIASGLNWLALVPWRRVAEAHWTERARKLYPARVGALVNIWLIPANCVLASQMILPEMNGEWIVIALSAWLGVVLGTYYFDREIMPWLRFSDWLRYVLVSWLMRLGVWAILLLAVWCMPEEMGPVGWGIALATLCFMVALSWRLWIHILSWLRVLKRPPERLQRIVSETTRRLHVPVRNVWLLTAPVSYAAALPLSRELIFSNRLVDLHPDEEIAVICAHELGHLAESRSVLAGRLIGSLTLFPWVFARPAFHAWQVGGIFYLLIATVLLWIFTQRLSRRMEVCADRFAHLHQGEEGIYARALEKLYETNQMPAVMPDDRQMHPHLYDRMLAAGITPGYPRPLAPASRSLQRIVMVTVLVILIVWRLVQEDWITF